MIRAAFFAFGLVLALAACFFVLTAVLRVPEWFAVVFCCAYAVVGICELHDQLKE